MFEVVVSAVVEAAIRKMTNGLPKALKSPLEQTYRDPASQDRVWEMIASLSDGDRVILLRMLEEGKTLGSQPYPPTSENTAKLIDSPIDERTAAGVALALKPDHVFRDARRRIDLVFKLNLGVAIILALILLLGLGGAVVSAVFLGRDIWAMVFGGVAMADIIGLFIFKPLTAINAAIIASQRLDVIHLRVREQLTLCNEHADLERRIKCQSKVWDTMQREFAALSTT